MPTIRELVAAIRHRDGVEAAIVLGRDGLLIDGQSVPNLDASRRTFRPWSPLPMSSAP
jgi:predicted regulator of Ras-like GTPase activity (Roadblock/LC7/MglB family)